MLSCVPFRCAYVLLTVQRARHLYCLVMQAMLCARVAAVVKACSFVITADLATHDIPYGGDGMVARIHSILDRGSTDDLDAHRCGGHHRIVCVSAGVHQHSLS